MKIKLHFHYFPTGSLAIFTTTFSIFSPRNKFENQLTLDNKFVNKDRFHFKTCYKNYNYYEDDKY